LEFLAETFSIMDMINHILASQASADQSKPDQSGTPKRSVDEITKAIVNMLRDALELQPSEKLGT
jgi:isocitrate lyase